MRMRSLFGSLFTSLLLLTALHGLAACAPELAAPELAAPELAALEGTASARLPLSTRGRFIVDATGARFKLASVNWYGASDSKHVVGGLHAAHVDEIVDAIVALGFNSVRLPFSNEMLRADVVPTAELAANPDLQGLTALEVYDAVVEALTRRGVVVIINNHTTHGMWCCDYDSDGLWYTTDVSEAEWLDDWRMMALRYRDNPLVAGVDLRNEVRPANHGGLPRVPTWGGATFDWRAAAERAAEVVQQVNPALLIVVEGLNFPREHLMGVRDKPIRLRVPNKLVYGAHNYAFTAPGWNLGTKYGEMDEPALRDVLDREFGFVVDGVTSYTAPVWVSEFGTSPNADESWYRFVTQYLFDKDLDFAYWALNASPKADGSDEPFALLEADWRTPRSDFRVQALQRLLSPRFGPGVEADFEGDPAHHMQVLRYDGWDASGDLQEDWAPYAFKATCGEGARVVGVATQRASFWRSGYAVLCASDGGLWPSGDSELVRYENGDAGAVGAHTGGDWRPGRHKLECDEGAFVSGLAQKFSAGRPTPVGIRCTRAAAARPKSCEARALDGHDNRGTHAAGDWAEGRLKGQCGLGEYVAGVSVRNGAPEALLCCR